uniref:Pentatricopeptide repeat-containing protein n=1 Tax=Davidia involucrata TaxID=16924 RepID=A0A5B6YKN7_DAVIN
MSKGCRVLPILIAPPLLATAVTRKGIFEDHLIYSSLICSFTSIREVKEAEELFQQVESKKMLRDAIVFLELVLMYIEEGLMEKSLEIVVAMKHVKIRVYDCILCVIVNGFSKRRGLRAAVRRVITTTTINRFRR